jgi:hypothetical protein
MDDVDDCTDGLLCLAAQRLTGYRRRSFQAEVTRVLCGGSARRAERRFGWGRVNVGTGLHELDTGIRCVENFATRGQRRTEDANPQLAADIRVLVEPHTHADPELKSERRYTNLSAREVRERLRAAMGYAVADLPSERTMRDILNRLGYRLKRIQKGKPLKKTAATDAIFANLRAVPAQTQNDPGTLEISVDTKAKVSEGAYARGGKNADGFGRDRGEGMGPRPAGEAEVDAVGHPDGRQRSVDPALRVEGNERLLGGRLESVVGARVSALSVDPPTGDLPGQRAEQFGHANSVPQARR